MPSETQPLRPRRSYFAPPKPEPNGSFRAWVEAPGTAPGSDRFIPKNVYRHSRLATGKANIGGSVPLLKPAPHHSASVSQSVAPAPGIGPPSPPRPSSGPGPSRRRSCGRCCFNWPPSASFSARSPSPPACPPCATASCRFPDLTVAERAGSPFTVLPHAALALLVLAAARFAPGRVGFARPALPRRAVLTLILWPPLQVAWTAGLLLATGTMPVRAWRLSPFLTGEVFHAWTLWLVCWRHSPKRCCFAATSFRASAPSCRRPPRSRSRPGLRPLPRRARAAPAGLGPCRSAWRSGRCGCGPQPVALHRAPRVSNGAVVLARVWSTG